MRNAARITLGMFLSLAVAGAASTDGFFRVKTFRAKLSDAETVPAFVSPTDARGIFVIRKIHSKLRYTLDVSNLTDAVVSHIHCAPVGEVGPAGVTLFQTAPTTLNGTIAHGPILAPDPGNACGWRISTMSSGHSPAATPTSTFTRFNRLPRIPPSATRYAARSSSSGWPHRGRAHRRRSGGGGPKALSPDLSCGQGPITREAHDGRNDRNPGSRIRRLAQRV